MRRLLKRIKQASRFSDTQGAAVFLMTVPMVLGYATGLREFNQWVALALLCFWPAVAFIINFLDQRP